MTINLLSVLTGRIHTIQSRWQHADFHSDTDIIWILRLSSERRRMFS